MAAYKGVVTYKATDLTAFMTLESVKIEKTSERATQYDESGNVKGTAYYREQHKCTATGTIETAASIPDIGDSLTVGGVEYVVENVVIEEKNEDYATVEVTGVYDVPTA